jgi:hypothetical protein
MKTLSLAGFAGILVVAGALAVPTASFAYPFVFGGPGYQAPVRSAMSESRAATQAYAYERGPRAEAVMPMQHGSSAWEERACMSPPFSSGFGTCPSQ